MSDDDLDALFDPSEDEAPSEAPSDTYDPMVLPQQQPVLVQSVSKRLQRAFSPGTLTADKWQDEVHVVSQLAALSGKFTEALSGYRMLAPSVGVSVVNAAPSNHVHFHGTKHDMAGSPVGELQERLAQIQRARQQRTVDAHVDTE